MTTLRPHLPIATRTPSPLALRRGALARFAVPGWLAVIAIGQSILALRPGLNTTAFQDEGLYIFIGHRMISHILHGTTVTEHPGAYFSGAPGFYPPLAAIGDYFGGLQGARLLSLIFIIATMVCVYGITRELFGTMAGLFGAGAFAVNGSIIMMSHLATYDAMMIAFIAAAAWLAVRSAQRDGMAWAPIVAALLTAGFLAKYTAAIYVPVVAVLASAAGWRNFRWEVVRRAAFAMLATAVMTYFLLDVFARDLFRGIISTTTSRTPQVYTSTGPMVSSLAHWMGPWLITASLGALLLARRNLPVAVVLLLGSVIAVAEQVHMHEATSLSKHAGFGIVFAAPLIGYLLSTLCRKTHLIATPLALAAVGAMAVSGLHYSTYFLTGWVSDSSLRKPLTAAIALNPNKAILGEEPSPQRYELSGQTSPQQWNDTFAFSYGSMNGEQAYADAINQTHFGTIYLSMTTTYGRWIENYLTTNRTPYRLQAKAPRYLRGRDVGDWLIYVPRVSPN